MKIEGKVAVVTGAASGIGRSIARRFTAEGGLVVAVDLDEGRLAKVSAELECESVVADISSESGIAAICDRERIDILCNNAGILDSLTPLLDVDDELWHRVIDVNLTGPFKLSRAVVKMMVDQGGGTVVNTCSAASLSGGRAGCAYTAAKHGLLGLTRSVAWYYGDQNIRCNAIAPGAIQTKMHHRAPPHAGGLAKYSQYFGVMPEQGKAMAVADVALFLACDDSRYINGEIITVDGGWNAF
jgi:NAD(P)-dependent dehydrogenase (short-subunit alcohol dehydrogenase family)